ncbi:MAG: polysaccharide deacetylase family protein [Acidimicrobiales bacterium]
MSLRAGAATGAHPACGHVCLSFDFDGPSLWIQRRQTDPTSVSRGEFGAVAVPRILDLLTRRNLTATFFVPGHTAETYPNVVRAISDAGCELALHGYAHELNSRLDTPTERGLLERCTEVLAAVTGSPPVGYRAPSGVVTDQTLELLVEAGLRYDSSLMGHDYRPYRVRVGTGIPEDGPVRWGTETSLIELPWSWTVDDYVHLEFVAFPRMLMPGLRSPVEMFANFSGDVRWMVDHVDRGVATFVFHPQVIGRGHRLRALEAWLDELADLGVSFDRMDAIAAAVADGQVFGRE